MYEDVYNNNWILTERLKADDKIICTSNILFGNIVEELNIGEYYIIESVSTESIYFYPHLKDRSFLMRCNRLDFNKIFMDIIEHRENKLELLLNG